MFALYPKVLIRLAQGVLLLVLLTAVARACPTGPLEIEWRGTWYRGSVIDGPNPRGLCKVTYQGWSSDWDEWVTKTRLRPLSAGGVTGCPSGLLEIEWNGSWYRGHVLEGPDADGRCLITYEGWESRWDEWVGAERLRPLDDLAPKHTRNVK